jgi:hypothetical protein
MLVWWQWGDYSDATTPQQLLAPINIAPDIIAPQNSGEVNSTLTVPANNALHKSAEELQQNLIPRATDSKSDSEPAKAVAA